jgi:hypothetical protein
VDDRQSFVHLFPPVAPATQLLLRRQTKSVIIKFVFYVLFGAPKLQKKVKKS